MTWQPVIGLEIHAQVATDTKMFCGCRTTYGGRPNHQTCPVCLGLPGSLPVVNSRAVELAVMLGLATGAEVHPTSVFARKNYFYPDLPKGYQISQHDRPLCTGGSVEIDSEDRGLQSIRLERIHLEEDAGKSSHANSGHSLVDLNRAGTPLVEIVSRPDLRSAAEAVAYMKAVHGLVRWLGVSDGNMEQGSLRCDANVSVHRPGEPFGVRCELKNINSFRFVGQAVRFEIQRQIDLLEGGESFRSETRTWDAPSGRTVFMRNKEGGEDYRYFPEPDLPPLVLDEQQLDLASTSLPELPRARAARFVDAYELPAYDAGVLTADRALADWFESGARALEGDDRIPRTKLLSNWTMGEVLRRLKEDGLEPAACPLRVERLVQLVGLLHDKVISHPGAKQVFEVLWTEDVDPAEVVEARGLRAVSDHAALDQAVQAVIAAHPDELAKYLGGKKKLFGFFMGRLMGATKGKADPKAAGQRLRAALSALED